MACAPVGKTALGLCFPTVVTMLAISAASAAESFFAAGTGSSQSDKTAAAAAIGIMFPVSVLFQVVSFALGMGAASVISRALGNEDEDCAETASVFSFFSAISVGIMISLSGCLLIKPLVGVLGASADSSIGIYARRYGSVYMACAPLAIGASVLSILLRARGKALQAAAGITGGAVLDVLLMHIFVSRLLLGVVGIALAGLFSQLFAFLTLLLMYIAGNNRRLDVRVFIRSFSLAREIVPLGLPSVIRQGLTVASAILLNNIAAQISDSALFSASVSSKVFTLFFGIAIGIGQGISPLIGFSYGSGNGDRLERAFRLSSVCGSLILLACCGVCLIFPDEMTLLMAHTISGKAADGTSRAIMIQCAALPFVQLGIVCNMAYQAAGRKIASSFLAAVRQGVFYIPLLLVLARFWGESGLWLAAAASDVLTFVLSVPFSVYFIRKMRKQIRQAGVNASENPAEAER